MCEKLKKKLKLKKCKKTQTFLYSTNNWNKRSKSTINIKKYENVKRTKNVH